MLNTVRFGAKWSVFWC